MAMQVAFFRKIFEPEKNEVDFQFVVCLTNNERKLNKSTDQRGASMKSTCSISIFRKNWIEKTDHASFHSANARKLLRKSCGTKREHNNWSKLQMPITIYWREHSLPPTDI